MRCSLRIRVPSSSVSIRIGGRPIRLPFRRASASPALTRSPMSARSNCAIAPNIWNTSSPEGSDVSMASVAEHEVDSELPEQFERRHELPQ